MKITIHTPSAGVRAITIDGKPSSRYTIENAPGQGYALKDSASNWNGKTIAYSKSVRELKFNLRRHLDALSFFRTE
jgi:hypothetical protein